MVDVMCGGWWMDMGCGVCVCVWWMGQDGMGNQIGDGGAQHMARALEMNTTITEIDLGGVWWMWCAYILLFMEYNVAGNPIGGADEWYESYESGSADEWYESYESSEYESDGADEWYLPDDSD